MKFSDGYWMMREGVRAFHPVEVLDVDAGPGSFRCTRPCSGSGIAATFSGGRW